MALPQARDPGSPPCLGTHQHTPTDAGTPKHASTGPNPTVAARPVPGRRSGAVPCPQLTAGTVSSRRGWSRSRAPGSFPRGTAPAASRPPPARWGRGTSWAQRGHTGTPRATGHPPQAAGTRQQRGASPEGRGHPTGTSCAMGHFPCHGGAQGVGGQRGNHAMGHPNIPWGTQPCHRAPKYPLGHPNILWGTHTRGDSPMPWGPATPWDTRDPTRTRPWGPFSRRALPPSPPCDRHAAAPTPGDAPRLTPASPGAARCPRAWGWGDSPAGGGRGSGGSAAAAGTGWGSARGSQTALRGQRGVTHPALPGAPLDATKERPRGGSALLWCPIAGPGALWGDTHGGHRMLGRQG